MTATAQLVALLVIAGMIVPQSAQAGTVSIGINPGNQREVIVEAKDATVPEILERLKQYQGFEIELIGEFAAPGPLTRRYVGECRHVLERILENENHLIVSSERWRTVERVAIYGGDASSQGARAAHAPLAAPQTPVDASTTPPPLDPVVLAALARAKDDAEAAKVRGEVFPPEYTSPGPMRRSAANGWGRVGRRGL